MTDHYAEAIKCLDIAHKIGDFDEARIHVAEAQVHASLAGVAETRRMSARLHSVDEVLAEVANDTRTIPWPPSEGLIQTIADVFRRRRRNGTARDIASAVLNVIGTGDE